MARINFDYTQDAVKQLDDLKVKLGVGSRAEVIRYAQAILNWSVQQAENGNQIVSINSGSGLVKELTVPQLDEIRARVKVKVFPKKQRALNRPSTGEFMAGRRAAR